MKGGTRSQFPKIALSSQAQPPKNPSINRSPIPPSSQSYTHIHTSHPPFPTSIQKLQSSSRTPSFYLEVPPADLRVDRRVAEVVVRVELAERVLREELLSRRSVERVPISSPSASLFEEHQPPFPTCTGQINTKGSTYTWKQSSMNAYATGVIDFVTSSGIGGVSPFAIL